MPRVNRDLQRRMAARRERERRRPPTERRYEVTQLGAPDAVDALPEHEDAALASPALTGRTSSKAARAVVTPRPTARPTPKPFSAYRAEYQYVVADLRRIVVVMGSLLVVLIVLHFVFFR